MRKLIDRFRSDARGSVALVAGLSAVPLVLAAGVAVDMARAAHENATFQASIDAAALALAASDLSNTSGLTAAQLQVRMAQLSDMARKYISANYTPHFYHDTQIGVNVTVDSQGTVGVQGSHDFPTAIMRIVGIDKMNLAADAQVKKSAGLSENVEVFLVMDTTGSMSQNNKIVDAKAAAKLLLSEVLGDKTTDPHLKFALVPFSGSVNVGPQYRTSGWIDTTGVAQVSKLNFTDTTWHNMKAWDNLKYKNAQNQTVTLPWNGCVEARLGTYATDDTVPSATTPDTLFTPYFAPDEASTGSYVNDYIGTSGSPVNEYTGLSATQKLSDSSRQKNQKKYPARVLTATSVSDDGPWFNCAASAIVPLTDSRAVIEAGIDAMTARGNTVLPEGLAWGWRVMSPTLPFTEGAAYNDKKWRKVVVFMTDGENDVSAGANSLNGSYYTSYGYVTTTLAKNRFGTTSASLAESNLDAKLLTVCTGIKAKAEMRPNPKDVTQMLPSIELYTIGFQSPTASANLLKSCATSPDHYYVNAADGTALKDTFRAIGERLKTMYLSE
jgi:Flp pilus assembly protein TadG